MLKRLFTKNEFTRNVFSMMMGTLLGQLIPILFSPILTRLFHPVAFGDYAIYLSIVYVLSSFVCLRYEVTVVLAKKRYQAINMMVFCLVLAFVMSLILQVGLLAFKKQMIKLFGVNVTHFYYLIMISVFVAAAYQVFYYWLSRTKQFRKLSISKILQAVVVTILSLVLGVSGYSLSGLVYAAFFSQFVVAIWFAILTVPVIKKASLSWGVIKKQAIHYNEFPRFQTLSTLIEKVGNQMPVFLLAAYFNPAIVGFYALAQQVSVMPVTLISRSTSDVFMQKASELYAQTGECKAFFLKTTLQLTLLSLPPFLILQFCAPFLFRLIFGHNWYLAGVYTQLMAVKFLFQLVVNPLSVMFYVAQKQKLELLLQIYLTIASFLGITAGYYFFHSAELALLFFTLTYVIKYALEFWLAYEFSKGNFKKGAVA